MSDLGVFTPYSTVASLFTEEVSWVSEEHRQRLSAYDTYEKMYWNAPESYRLSMRGENEKPIYVPNARTVVDETSHYLVRGLNIADTEGEDTPLNEILQKFLKREMFYSRFHTAKHAGVYKGDWVFHMTGDPDKPPTRRLSLTSVDPASYFPITHPDDPDDIIGVDLVEQITYEGRIRVKQLRYMMSDDLADPRVLRQERILELDEWWDGKAAKVVQIIAKEEVLPETITALPVYHFRNIVNDGDPFGSSELRGFEYLLGGINQSVSDEDLALALDGLGVWATDAPKPSIVEGSVTREVEWEVFPGMVAEVPAGSEFRRVEGVRSVTPVLDHIKMLQANLYEGAGTFRGGVVDVQVAESGIALAIRFSPTMAKIEQRDEYVKATLEHMFYDWKSWQNEYEEDNVGLADESEIEIKLGEKLPVNAVQVFNELNQLYDRKLISGKYYRDELKRRLNWTFPEGLETEIIDEQKKLMEMRMELMPQAASGFAEEGDPSVVPGANNKSNNKNRPNESAGTEATSNGQRS